MYRYDLDVLRKMVPARKVAETELGCRIINDRCQAVWRGGDGWNVSLNADGGLTWYKIDSQEVLCSCYLTSDLEWIEF